MKLKILLTLMTLLATLTLSAEESFASEYGYLSSYKEAKIKALKEQKPMMILFVTASCPWCQKLKNQTLKKEEAYAIINNSFIPVMLDKETDEFPKFLMPQVVPTITFVEPKEERKFFQILGYKSLEDAVILLKQARIEYKGLKP